MPTLTNSQEPDSYNIDYYYSKYKDRHGVGLQESKPQALHVLPAGAKTDLCDEKKTQHYFKVPLQPSITTCFCGKFHTSFTSQHYKISHPTTIGQPQSQTKTIISKQSFKKAEELPASPISKLTNQTQTSSSSSLSSSAHVLFPNFQTNPAPTAIIAHSQHYHTCFLCKLKDIQCVFTDDQQQNHAPDYTVACIFKGSLIHRSCVPNLLNIKLKPINPTTPLNADQKKIVILYKISTMSVKDKIQLYKSIFSKKPNSQKFTKQQKQKQKQNTRDTSNDLDWFKEYLITDEMRKST